MLCAGGGGSAATASIIVIVSEGNVKRVPLSWPRVAADFVTDRIGVTGVVVLVDTQAALACCLVALFTMCLWFVRVTIVQRRRQVFLEMQWAANQPTLLTPEEIAALPSEQYKVSGRGGCC